jgi:2-polyprenyl-6-hydroxyphenyl methylase/3-demethylubiquinone-9 3-methyltransferase
VASFAAAILGAEYVLRIVPAGTHEWTKFVTPEELAAWVRQAGLTTREADVTGLLYHPIGQRWEYVGVTHVNYALTARKPATAGASHDAAAAPAAAPRPNLNE